MRAQPGYGQNRPRAVAAKVSAMVSPKNIASSLAAIVLLFTLADPRSAGGDPSFITFSGGWFDFNRKHDEGAEFRVEYRSNKRFWIFKPFVMASAANNGMTFLGAGVLIDIYFGPNWVVTPSFAATWWRGRTEKLNLGHPVEFRSQLEVARRFANRSRLGLSISHYSNANLAKKNPGTESLMLNYSVPLAR